MFQSPPTSHFSSHKTTILVDWIPENPLKSTKYYGWFPENTNDSRIAPGWIVWIPKNRCWNESDFTFRGGVPRVYGEFRWFIDLWEYTKNKRKNDRNLYTCCVYIYIYIHNWISQKKMEKSTNCDFDWENDGQAGNMPQFWIDPFGWLSLDTNFKENEHLK